MGFLFLLGSEQRSGDLDKLSNLLFVCDSFKEDSDPISVVEELDLCKPERWPRPESIKLSRGRGQQQKVGLEPEKDKNNISSVEVTDDRASSS